jgi:hypothetical protein
MPPKQRTARERRETMTRDKAKRRKPAGPRVPKSEAYDRNKRVAVRAELRLGEWL